MGRVAAGIIIAWPSTNGSIPSGWTRATAYDGRYVRQIATSSTAPGTTGGSASHNHNANGAAAHTHCYAGHSHTWGNTANGGNGGGSFRGAGSTFCGLTHNHTASDGGASTYATDNGGATTWSTATVEPLFFTVILVKSSGAPNGIPNNALTWMNGAAPTGWSTHSSSANRLWKGAAAAGDGGSTGGTGDSHSHTLASHTHTRVGAHTHTVVFASHSDGTILAQSSGAGRIYQGHPHPSSASVSANLGGTVTCAATDATGNGDMTPLWQKMLPVQNGTGHEDLPKNVIAMWDGALSAIPAPYWKLCDASAGTPNLSQSNFTRGAANSGEVGSAGGASTHPHGSGSHGHSDTASTHAHSQPAAPCQTAAVPSFACACACAGAQTTHGHASAAGNSGNGTPSAAAKTISACVNTDNAPVYTGVAYIQLVQVPPLPEGKRTNYNGALHGYRGRGAYDTF